MINFDFQLTLNLDRFVASTLDPAINAKMTTTAETMVAIAQQKVPVDTGLLKSTIDWNYDAASYTLIVYANTPYVLPVEFGTRHMAAQPFLRPSLLGVVQTWHT